MKKLLAVLLALLLAASLCACSGAENAPAADTEMMQTGDSFATAGESDGTADRNSTKSTAEAGASGTADPVHKAKLIYTAQLDMETTAFDQAVSGLDALVTDCGGYYESSSVSGDSGSRSASFTVRVPAKQFQPFLTKAGALCTVTGKQTAAEDVGEAYADTEGRLKTQRTKLERLQVLLAKAEKMEDIITLEDAISDTESQIESLTGELRSYDSLVDFSTVDISLQETARIAADDQSPGFASRLTDALHAGWQGFVRFLQAMVLLLAYGWIWLVLAGAALIAALAARRARRSRKKTEKAAPEVGSAHDKSDGV